MRVVIAFEHREGKSGRGYAKVIEDYSAKSLKPLFDRHIKNDASILADGWRGYSPLKEEYPDLKQTLSLEFDSLSGILGVFSVTNSVFMYTHEQVGL